LEILHALFYVLDGAQTFRVDGAQAVVEQITVVVPLLKELESSIWVFLTAVAEEIAATQHIIAPGVLAGSPGLIKEPNRPGIVLVDAVLAQEQQPTSPESWRPSS